MVADAQHLGPADAIGLPRRPMLTEAAVEAVLVAARQRAVAIGVGFTVVIVDDSTELRGVRRMDGADLLTVGLATGKARLAAGSGMPTKQWRHVVAADPYLGLTVPTALDRVLGGAVLFGGGYPIRVDGHVVGGIGVSGGAEDQDDAVARAGLTGIATAEQYVDAAETTDA